MVSILYLIVRNIAKGLDIGLMLLFLTSRKLACVSVEVVYEHAGSLSVCGRCSRPHPACLLHQVTADSEHQRASPSVFPAFSSTFSALILLPAPALSQYLWRTKALCHQRRSVPTNFFLLFCFSRSLIAMRAHTGVWRRSSGEFHGPGGLPLPSIAVEEWWHHFHSPWSDRSARWQNNRLLTPAAKGRSRWQAF